MKRFFCLLWLVLIVPAPAFAACSGAEARSARLRYALSGAVVFDNQTGLTWQRCSLGMAWTGRNGCAGEKQFLTQNAALEGAQNAGDGWRVPTIEELYSLVDKSCGMPATDTRTFPDVAGLDEENNSYWTTSKVGMGNLVYYVDFVNADADGHSPGFQLAVRLVRTGR